MLKERELELIGKKQVIVSFYRDGNKVKHRFADSVPVTKLKPNPAEDNRGAVIIKEMPVDNAPFGLYYAGVDPIFNTDTSTSKSLMSIRIWIGYHEVDGKICEPRPVAWYIGRHKKVTETYQICLDLIEFYNARAAVENNVKDFIEWMIRQGKSRYMMRRRELTVVSEMMPNSTIRDEIGVRMEGEFKKRALEKYVNWMETPISTEFDLETGESKDIYNVSKIEDLMLIKECQRFNAKLNTDRIVSDMLALIAVQSDTNRHIINQVKPYDPHKRQVKVQNKITSPFQTRTRINSPFKTFKGHF